MTLREGGIVVFSGGSAANSLVDVFESIRKARSCSLSYIIPISDNGGSTSEIIRVFGGPGIGDVRSRLIRLIPQQPYSKEREAIGTLLSYRLSSTDTREARLDWTDIVDGTSLLWKGISSAKKELLRSFLNLLNLEILKRSRPPVSTFDFRSASVGNLFLTGARLFSGSFESAIYLLSAICGIPDEEVKVIPSINSNFSHHIAAELEDGSVIVGQNSISHPVSNEDSACPDRKTGTSTCATPQSGSQSETSNQFLRLSQEEESFDLVEEEEDAHPPFTLPTLRTNNIIFTKSAHELSQLPSRINRVYYVNSFGQEILPPSNPRAAQALLAAHAVVYSIGSLYTSIVPNLVLRGIGDAMRRSQAKVKILVLNGCLDREVGPQNAARPFSAADFVDAIVRAGEQSRGVVWQPRPATNQMKSGFDHNTVSHLRPVLSRSKSDSLGLRIDQPRRTQVLPPPMLASAMPSRAASPSSLEQAHSRSDTPQLSSRSSSKLDSVYQNYVTHLIHLPNSFDTPFVDSELLESWYGIKCVQVSGRKNNSGPGMLYIANSLQSAIEEVLGALDESLLLNSATSGEMQRGRSRTIEN